MVSWLCYALHVLLNKRYVNIKYLSRHILTLTILGLTIPKTVNIRWSPWSRIITRENHHLNGFNYGCQLTIRKLAKTKKKKSSLSEPRNLTWCSWEKVTTYWCDDPNENLAGTRDCLGDTFGIVSKHIRVKFRKSLGNINYSRLPPRWTKLGKIVRVGDNLKLFWAGSGFTDQIFTGEFSGVNSAGTLRQGIFMSYLKLIMRILNLILL